MNQSSTQELLNMAVAELEKERVLRMKAEKTIADCDYTVKIPMYHGVDSLNVAAASAVAFWELRPR